MKNRIGRVINTGLFTSVYMRDFGDQFFFSRLKIIYANDTD